MKRTLMILSALSMAAVAGPFKLGADVNLGLVQPLIGSYYDRYNYSGSNGLGATIGPVAEFDFSKMFGVQTEIAYAYQSWSFKGSTSSTSSTYSYSSDYSDDFSQSNLELSLGPTFRLGKISAAMGYRWSVPLGGTVKASYTSTVTSSGTTTSSSKSKDYDITWAGSTPDTTNTKAEVLSTHNIYVKGGYEVIPHLTVGLDISIGLTGLIPKTNDADTKYDGDQPRSKNYETNRYALNVRYDFL